MKREPGHCPHCDVLLATGHDVKACRVRQETGSTCPLCGTPLGMFTDACPTCGQPSLFAEKGPPAGGPAKPKEVSNE